MRKFNIPNLSMGRTIISETNTAYAKYRNPRPFFQYTLKGNCKNLAPSEYGNFSGRPGPVSGIRCILNRFLKPVQNNQRNTWLLISVVVSTHSQYHCTHRLISVFSFTIELISVVVSTHSQYHCTHWLISVFSFTMELISVVVSTHSQHHCTHRLISVFSFTTELISVVVSTHPYA